MSPTTSVGREIFQTFHCLNSNGNRRWLKRPSRKMFEAESRRLSYLLRVSSDVGGLYVFDDDAASRSLVIRALFEEASPQQSVLPNWRGWRSFRNFGHKPRQASGGIHEWRERPIGGECSEETTPTVAVVVVVACGTPDRLLLLPLLCNILSVRLFRRSQELQK